MTTRSRYHICGLALAFACGCSSGTQAAPAPTSSTAATGSTAHAPTGPLPLLAGGGTKVNYKFGSELKPFLVFSAQKITVSASCAQPDGTLDCEAMRLLRKGKSVQLTPAELSVGIAPGAVICKKLGIKSTVGQAEDGNEDGFCSFADGSLVSHGSVDANVLAP